MPKNTTHTSGSNWSKTKNGGSVVSYNKYKAYKGLRNKVNKAEKKYNTLYKNGFNNPYKGVLNNTLNQINNSKFEYDLSKDSIYEQMRDSYLAMGNQAMQEAQADATSMTGGYANSYAETAGQRAMNSYASQVQNLVSQLYQQARSDYDQKMTNLYNRANLYNQMGAQSFSEYVTRLEQAAANRDYYYNKYNTMREASAKQIQKNNTWTKTRGGNSSNSTSKSGKK